VQSGMPRVHEPSECGIPAGTLDHDRDDLIAELIQNDLDQTPRTALPLANFTLDQGPRA
jgi:hypothetical protein